jgi:ribosomal protein S18 acetylase RimI-like enzyme
MSLRRASASDLPPILALHRAFYEHEGYRFNEIRSMRALRDLAGNDALGRILVIESEERIAGYVVITFGYSIEFGGRDAFVDELYVAPHARGRGLGTAALEEAERVSEQAGVLALHLEVEFTNLDAKRLYARRGWQEHTRQLMTKRLG